MNIHEQLKEWMHADRKYSKTWYWKITHAQSFSNISPMSDIVKRLIRVSGDVDLLWYGAV
jgi:hypothetical protein